MKKSNKILLDTSAIIALLKKEKGHEKVSDILATSAISTVNFAELVSVLARDGVSSDDIDSMIDNIIPDIIPFTHEISITTGKLLTTTKPFGLSLGDRACLATAIHSNIDVYTTDKAWANLNIPDVKIHLIR